MTTAEELDPLRDELLQLGTATLYEASGLDCYLPAALRPAWPGATIVGIALPVHAAIGDNLPLHRAVEVAVPGDVLVVDAGGAPHGYWGEILAVAAQQRGVIGLVIDGGVRDTQHLEILGFPAFSRWIAIEGTLKDDIGSIEEPICIGRAPIVRGDVVVADRDGIVVLPSEHFAEIVETARARAVKETKYLNRIRAGECTVDIYGFRSEGAS